MNLLTSSLSSPSAMTILMGGILSVPWVSTVARIEFFSSSSNT